MTSAHNIAHGFDRAGLSLVGVAAGCIQEARVRQYLADEEQAERNLTATQRALHAVERQRRDLLATREEAARLRAENVALRSENDRLKAELARMCSRALEAEGRLVRAAKAVAARRAA